MVVMRWHDYIRNLTPAEAEQLVNTLTLACGQVAAAVQLTSRNGPVSGVQGLLVRAGGAFAATSRQLAPTGGRRPHAPASPPVPTHAPALSWQEFLARLGAARAAMLLDRLVRATREARLAGSSALDDAPVEVVARHVERAEQAVEEVNEWITTALAELES